VLEPVADGALSLAAASGAAVENFKNWALDEGGLRSWVRTPDDLLLEVHPRTPPIGGGGRAGLGEGIFLALMMLCKSHSIGAPGGMPLALGAGRGKEAVGSGATST
jgi:hypothetical protein